MLDIKLIRERPDFVKGELAKRGVDPAGVDTEIATMIEKGVLPPGTTISPRDYMLPRELGGLYR